MMHAKGRTVEEIFPTLARGMSILTFAKRLPDKPVCKINHQLTINRERIMKFVCLGYMEPKKWETMDENQRNAMMDECFTYDDLLQKNGHFAGGQALQPAQMAKTLRWKDDRASVTDGPYAETKEQLGGILLLEARDLEHAVELMSKHSGVKAGPFEIRPAADLTEIVCQSEQRRSSAKSD
jgi:hypothetical protein